MLGERIDVNCFLRPIQVLDRSLTEFYQASTVGHFKIDKSPRDKSAETLFSFIIVLDDLQNTTLIKRAGWYDALSNVGGLEGFLFFAVAILFEHFTAVDYLTTMIKGIYLQTLPHKEFMNRYTPTENLT